MTMTNTLPGSRSDVVGAGLTRTARTTGLLYLAPTAVAPAVAEIIRSGDAELDVLGM